MTDLQDTRGGHEHPHSPAIIWGGVGGDGVIIGEGPLTQTLDTLRRGKVFRMAWVGGGGGLTCVRGVSRRVCVGGGGGSWHALLAGRGGGAPLPGPLLTSIVMKSLTLMNSSLFLRTKHWLFTSHSACTTRHVFMQRGDSKCNLGYQDFYNIHTFNWLSHHWETLKSSSVGTPAPLCACSRTPKAAMIE